MPQINPARIEGKWREGYALDRHVVSSEFIGYNDIGHPQFDTKRSEIGELIYQLKYRNDQSAVEPLTDAAAAFVKDWRIGVDALVPATPSRDRKVQPVYVLGTAIAKRLGIAFAIDWINRTGKVPELKNVTHDERIRLLQGAHTVNEGKAAGKRVLLLDDLFQTGATLNAMAAALYDQGGAAEVYALAMTRAGRR